MQDRRSHSFASCRQLPSTSPLPLWLATRVSVPPAYLSSYQPNQTPFCRSRLPREPCSRRPASPRHCSPSLLAAALVACRQGLRTAWASPPRAPASKHLPPPPPLAAATLAQPESIPAAHALPLLQDAPELAGSLRSLLQVNIPPGIRPPFGAAPNLCLSVCHGITPTTTDLVCPTGYSAGVVVNDVIQTSASAGAVVKACGNIAVPVARPAGAAPAGDM